MIYERVGSNIRSRRRRKGMTQKELAELCKCSVATLSGVEAGSKRISLGLLEQIAAALNCSIYDLIEVPESRYSKGEFRRYYDYRLFVSGVS